MRLPTWDELQRVPGTAGRAGVSSRPVSVRRGPPGSGKTVLAIYRAQLAAALASDETGPSVAIVTFNRMLRRLLDMLEEADLRVGTMHSFVGHDYRSRMHRQPPHQPSDWYSYDWDAMFSCLEDAKEHPNRSHLVVDEGQDLPKGFFEYASRYASRTITVFADENQALSERHTTLEQIKTASGLGDPIILSHNHRNTPEIARLAEHFHSGRLPVATVVRPSLKELPRIVRSDSLQSTAKLISNWCDTRGGSIGVIVDWNDTGSTLHGNLRRRLRKSASTSTVVKIKTKIRSRCSNRA